MMHDDNQYSIGSKLSLWENLGSKVSAPNKKVINFTFKRRGSTAPPINLRTSHSQVKSALKSKLLEAEFQNKTFSLHLFKVMVSEKYLKYKHTCTLSWLLLLKFFWIKTVWICLFGQFTHRNITIAIHLHYFEFGIGQLPVWASFSPSDLTLVT